MRGDADHPVSRGYTCPKGRGIPEWHHAPARLDHPRLDGHRASWDEVLDDLGARITAVVAESGPDAVALYLATGFAYDSAGQVASFMWHGGLGSTSVYTAATVDNAPALVAAEMVTGNGMLNPVWEPGNGGPVVFVGTNPVVSHGYGTTLPDPVSYLREHQASGGPIWVLDPRRTETAALADHHVPVAPGSDVEVLAALVAGVLADGADPEELDGWCDPADLDELRRVLEPFTLDSGGGTRRCAGRRSRGAPPRRAHVRRPARRVLRHRPGHGPRRRAGRVAPVVPAGAHRLARLVGRHAVQPRCGQPAREVEGRRRAHAGPADAGPTCAGWSARCRPSRWSTRSRPATCGCSS